MTFATASSTRFVVWHLDRLHRQPKELLPALAELAGVPDVAGERSRAA
jgi:hypothetical protein